MFSWRNKKTINTFQLKKAPYLELHRSDGHNPRRMTFSSAVFVLPILKKVCELHHLFTFLLEIDIRLSISASKDADWLVVEESQGSSQQICQEISCEITASQKVTFPGLGSKVDRRVES